MWFCSSEELEENEPSEHIKAGKVASRTAGRLGAKAIMRTESAVDKEALRLSPWGAGMASLHEQP